ncbi:MAG: hypothetical protein K8L99_05285, partial [Anaerolineae bacterium]|nr:hypothetical protein [Anaerolineae bacterium]
IPDLPDWLREDTDVMPELEDIFATEDLSESQEEDPDTEGAAEVAPAAMLDIDTDDPWVVAFDEETETDPDVIPDWYRQNVNDPERIAQVERQTGSQNDELQEVDLEPETELEAGELEPAVPDWLNLEEAEVEPAEVPDWLSAEVTVSETGAAPTGTDVPEWLQDADVSIDSGDIPDWLRETVEEEQAEATPAPEIAATVETPAPAPEVASPAPVPVTAAIDVEATLAQARKQINENNLDGGLIEYESIIRANKALDAVVSDLTKLIDEHDDNPAVYRVLGDGYMRQGKLQSALDTYRKALNQL